MKRILPLFLVVLLLGTVVCVPASAAEGYELVFDQGRFLDTDFVLPEGTYSLFILANGQPFFAESVVIDVFYSYYDIYGTYIYSDTITILGTDGVYYSFDFEIRCYSDHVEYSYYPPLPDGIVGTMVFTPVSEKTPSPGISAIVSSDTISGVLSALFNLITGNPLFSALCASSLILVCIPIYTRAKNSLR